MQYLDQGRVKLREEKVQIIERLLNIQNGTVNLATTATAPRSSTGRHTDAKQEAAKVVLEG